MGRVLMVVRPSKGGAFSHVSRLAAALSARGHDVALAGPHGTRAADLGLEVIELEIGRAVAPRADAAAVVELGRAYARFAPDLIHAHGSKGGVAARLARARRPRAPLVLTPHNYAFTNWFSRPLERGAYRAIEMALSPFATRVLCVCEAERRVARTVGPPWRTRVVHNGIEPLPAAEPGERWTALRRTGPLLTAVTELQAPKGVPSMIEAMPALLRRSPGARLAVAGEGPQRPELEDLIERLGVGAAVELLGQVDDVRGLLAATDIFVAPGWSESFPYANLEAMSVGLPIVATEVGGVGEAIEDGVTGRLVAARDPGALAVASLELIADPDLAAALGRRARERQIERFSFERMLAGTLAVYAEVGFE